MAQMMELSHMVAPRETVRAIVRGVSAGVAPLRTLPPMTLSEWAAEHFFLSAEGSHMQGRWEAYPFQCGWMDAFSNDDIEEVTLQKAKRVGYTKTLLAFIAYNAAHRRRKQALWQPTDDDRDSFVKSEVEPMIRDVAAVRAVQIRRGADDTMKLKAFMGSLLHLLGGKAARAYRRITTAVSMLDEADGFDQQIEKSADPITLARGRLEGAPFPKLIAGSTPRIKHLSHVEHRVQQAEAVMRYHIDCPRCGIDHPLDFGSKKQVHGMKWQAGQPDTVRHVCPHCHESITQADYLAAMPGGQWVDAQRRYTYGQDAVWRDGVGMPCKAPRHVAFLIWTAYSPQRGWPDIAREFLEAKVKLKAGDVGPMQGFMNETLGETWEMRSDSADEHELMNRPHTYQVGTVPRGCLMLGAGIDTQDNRLEVVVWGFGRGEEMWVIDYQVIEGDPALDSTWHRLDDLLGARYPQVGRQGSLGIDAAAVDIGGHFTHAVYSYTRTRGHRRIVPVHGSRFDGRPIKGRSQPQDINWRGKIIKAGVKLWEVGTDTAKDLLHARLKIEMPGPGYVHFPDGLPLEFYKQLTAEGRMPQKTSTGEVYRWVKRRARNEVLDCTVYAIFCSHLLDLHRYTEKTWDRLQAAVEPELGLFDDMPPSPMPAVAPADDYQLPQPVVPARQRGRFGGRGTPWSKVS